MAGTTNPASTKTVTVVEGGSQPTTTSPSQGSTAVGSNYVGNLDNDLIWTSWLDDSDLWSLGYEHMDPPVF